MNRRWLAAALAALRTATCGTAAAQPAAIMVDAAPCVEIESALARLDCFDALARGAAKTSNEPRPAVDPQSSDSPAPAATASSTAASAEELTSEIVGLRELEPGRYEIELENGQLWRQTSSDRYRLQIGQPVRVYRARVGSRFFRLTVPALRGFVQVERVR
jgi:hypothetical protein